MKNRTTTIDIETLPASSDKNQDLLKTIKLSETELSKTALNGDFGRILCIGFIDEKFDGRLNSGVIGWDEEIGEFNKTEREILVEFWQMMSGFRPNYDRIVGHNIFDFDLRFILKRSRLHQVKPSVDFSFARYRNQPIYDTMYEWECWNFGTKISLDRLAKIFSLPSSKSEEINGSRIYEYFQSGNHQEIRDYCLEDVKLTREIFRRMTFTAQNCVNNKY
jgi:predicted PolB exonuclease-like 3'-5' exonuclease